MKTISDPQITQTELQTILKYDSNTGIFTWNKRSGPRKKGAAAGGLTGKGYVRIKVGENRVFAHRLAWMYVYGYFPENEIDHINRIRIDNRIINLRETGRTCNIRNSGVRKDNKTGVTGVSLYKDTNKWRASIKINKKNISLGYYRDFISAVQARWEAEKEYNFPTCNTTSSSFNYLKSNGVI